MTNSNFDNNEDETGFDSIVNDIPSKQIEKDGSINDDLLRDSSYIVFNLVTPALLLFYGFVGDVFFPTRITPEKSGKAIDIGLSLAISGGVNKAISKR